MAVNRRIFIPTSALADACRVRGLECALTMSSKARFRSPPSTLYTCPPELIREDWLGVASVISTRGFTDFDGIRADSFPIRRSIFQVRCVYQFRHQGTRF